MIWVALFYSVFFPALLLAIPRVAERIDTRLDGRPGFRVAIAGTIEYVLHDDHEGFY